MELFFQFELEITSPNKSRDNVEKKKEATIGSMQMIYGTIQTRSCNNACVILAETFG